MRGNRLLFLIIAGIVLAAGAFLWLLPRAERLRTPTLVRAWAGVEVGGDGVARTGAVEAAAGQEIRLHAVLETASRGDDEAAEPVYYSGAGQVEIDGRLLPALPPEELGGLGWVRILWFSIEHGVPFRELEHGADVDRFGYEPFFRPEWGSAWSIDGDLAAHFDSWLEEDAVELERNFGTLRYQVWVEAASDGDALVPDQRVRSPELPEATRLEVRLPGALGPSSAWFGLPGVQRGDGEWSDAQADRLGQLIDDRLAFDQASVLRDLLQRDTAVGDESGSLLVPLDGSTPWGSGDEGAVAPGDVVNVGDRWAVLLADSADDGIAGMLDGADLCFDFDTAAAVRRLDQIFVVTPEGEGDVFVTRAGPAP